MTDNGSDAPENDPMMLLAALARKFECTTIDLWDEIQGTSNLARIARELIGVERETRPRGAPRNDEGNWRLWVEVSARQRGKSVPSAIRNYIVDHSLDTTNPNIEERLKKQFYREDRRRGARPLRIADFYGSE